MLHPLKTTCATICLELIQHKRYLIFGPRNKAFGNLLLMQCPPILGMLFGDLVSINMNK
jgi:hypothetical protein